MKVKAEASKEESKLHESSLSDLPVADEQAEETKGGEGKTRLIVGDDQGLFVRR